MTVSASQFSRDIFTTDLLEKLSKSNISLPNLTKSNIRNEIALVSVYFDELKYTKIDQIPKMDLTSLISGIGGNLGLFLGLSICSFMELFELIWIIIMHKNE